MSEETVISTNNDESGAVMSVSEASKQIQAEVNRWDRTIYWITTGIVCVVMLFSAINFTFNDHFPYPEGAFAHLELPTYFKVELTIAKVLGVVALLIPGIPRTLKEFAYFGFAITLVSASIAHFSVGDAARPPFYLFSVVDPLIFLGVLAVSYRYFHKLATNQ